MDLQTARGMPVVLNVAEKPSVAKEASRVLSGGQPGFEQGLCVPTC